MSEPLRYRYFKYTRGTAPEPVIGVLIVEILERVGNTKFDDGLGWNLNLLLRLWIEARARLPLLLHQLAKTGQDKFAVLFGSALSVSRNTPAVLLSVWVASASAL